jgi:hypothetical protein
MRIPRELYQIEQMITQQFSHMRLAHVLGLVLWVYGTVLAKSACLSAVVIELLDLLSAQTTRQRLREWLRNGRDKARPCDAQVDVQACFPVLLRWVVQWWQGTTLPLAMD